MIFSAWFTGSALIRTHRRWEDEVPVLPLASGSSGVEEGVPVGGEVSSGAMTKARLSLGATENSLAKNANG